MMTSEIFVTIVTSLITIFGALISAYLIPLMKNKVTSEQLDQLSYCVTVAVRCAEQIYTPEQWKEKKAFVMNYVRDFVNTTIKIELSQAQLDTIVEGVVNEVKHSTEEVSK